MSDWQTFEGVVEPLVLGRATYTILRLPAPVARALASGGARRVEGEINDHPVNLALARAPDLDDVFLWAGRSLLDRVGATPGARVEVRLRPAAADIVDTPDDLSLALRQAGQTDRWQALTPGKRRGLLYQIDSARTATTRARRIAALIEDLNR